MWYSYQLPNTYACWLWNSFTILLWKPGHSCTPLVLRNSNVKSDWINTTLTDLRDLGIDKNLDQISTMCKNQFKVLVKSSLRNACFQSSLREKHKLKKGAEMCFEKFEILPYLHSTSCLNVSSMRKIYHIQTREIVLKYNYPTQFNDTFCRLHFICWWGLGGFW